jgi:hypothetical protein
MLLTHLCGLLTNLHRSAKLSHRLCERGGFTSLALCGLLGIAFAMSRIAFAADATAAKASTSIIGRVNDARGRPLSAVVIRLQSRTAKPLT